MANRKPTLKILIALFNNLEKSLAREDWTKVIRACEVFIGIVRAYAKQKGSLNNERK
jgi:hypothetical protein